MRGAVTQSTGVIRFGNYEADLRAGHLRKRGIRIRLRDQAFQVLSLLLEHPGEVVTREELRRRLWPDHVFVDFDNNLNTAIARLRDALGDSALRPRFIETLPKHGYRFVAVVITPLSRKARLLVLPFANPGRYDDLYLSDGFTEQIIGSLSRLAPDQLAVIANGTAIRLRASRKDAAQIAHELGADYLVEGSVQRASDRISANICLLRANDMNVLWANTYSGNVPGLFAFLNAVAQAVARQVGVAASAPVSTPACNFDAYNLYLRGRHEMRRMTAGSIITARQCFEEAIGCEARFAPAYDGLAESCWLLGLLGVLPPNEVSANGILAAMRALELDSTLAETHALLGWYNAQFDYDWPEVHREMRRALELNPASPVVRFRHAKGWLLPHGRIGEAIAEIEGALESDPLSSEMRHWLAIAFWLGRQYDRALEEGRRLLEQDPGYAPAHFGVGLYYREKHMYAEAVAAHRTAAELSGGAPAAIGWLGLALAQAGATAEARTLVERLHSAALASYVPPASIAWIHFGLGDTDCFFDAMQGAIDVRDDMIMPVKTYPFLDPIRGSGRYRILLRRMKLEA